MKTMTCKQLGGACDMEFSAEHFDEMKEQTQKHGIEMFEKKDEAHLAAMNKIREMMKTPGAMEEWFEAKKAEFEALPSK